MGFFLDRAACCSASTRRLWADRSAKFAPASSNSARGGFLLWYELQPQRPQLLRGPQMRSRHARSLELVPHVSLVRVQSRSSCRRGDVKCWSHVFTHKNRRRVGDGSLNRRILDHWSSDSRGDGRCCSHVSRAGVGAVSVTAGTGATHSIAGARTAGEGSTYSFTGASAVLVTAGLFAAYSISGAGAA